LIAYFFKIVAMGVFTCIGFSRHVVDDWHRLFTTFHDMRLIVWQRLFTTSHGKSVDCLASAFHDLPGYRVGSTHNLVEVEHG
jgi:hypothetical protein